MHEGATPKSAEPRHIWLVAAPGFLGSEIVKGTSGGDVMQMGHILKCVPPIRLGEVSVNEHYLNTFNKHMVHTFRNAIVLGYVSGDHFMLDSLVRKELLYF